MCPSVQLSFLCRFVRRIAEIAKGQITGREAARLREMLNVLAVKEGNLRKSSGTLKATERVQVDSGLQKISSALNSSSM